MSEPRNITEHEFKLVVERIDSDNERQDDRLDALESQYNIVNQLALNMERLATNMEFMAKEVSRQGKQLNSLEMMPAKRWDLVVTTIIGAVIGVIVGVIMKAVFP